MEKLYGVTAAIRSTIDVNGVKAELIRGTQTLLDAGSVRLVPTDTPARPGTLHVAIDPGTVLEVGDRIGGGRWGGDD